MISESKSRQREICVAIAAAIGFITGILNAPQALAQSPAPPETSAPAPSRPPAQSPPPQGETYLAPPPPAPVKAGPFYAFAGFALFAPDSNSELHHQRGDAVNLIAGAGYRVSRMLSLQLDFLAAGQKLDTPPGATPAPGTFADGSLETRMDTAGVALTARFDFLPIGRVVPYLAAGAGRYSTRLRTTSEDPLCQQHCFDTGPRVSRSSNDAGYHAALGGDYHFTAKDVLGVELRYLRIDASFEDLVPGKVRAGGTFAWMGYRRYF